MQTATAPVAPAATISAQTTTSIIDLSIDPFAPKNWQVTDHHKEIKEQGYDKKTSLIKWHPNRTRLYLSESQKKGRSVQGDYLEHETSHLNVLNVNVLHFLEKNPQEIPGSFWPTGDAISQSNVFWGTRYKNAYGKRFVGCLLCFQHGTALVSYSPIDHGFGGSDPAVIWE